MIGLIRAILIDDEEIAVRQLEYLLQRYSDIHVHAVFTDPVAALEKIASIRPDLVFLDIEMPVVSGFVVAEEIMRMLPDTYVVFVTAYDEYALKAFEYNAIDYILKPLSPRRIDRTIEKVLKNFSGGKAKNRWGSELAEARRLYSRDFNKMFAVEEDGKIFLLNPADIIMFTPHGRGAIIHTPERKYTTRHSMNYWEQRLAELDFFRCHKSFLVNFAKIESVLPMFNNTFLLKIAGLSREIPVSRNKARELTEILGL